MRNSLIIKHQITNCEIAFCYGKKAYSKYISKKHNLNINLTTDAMTMILRHKALGFSIVIGIKKFENIYEMKALIVHELSHAVSEIMNEYGFDCDEFRSYTIQWLYVEIMPFIDKLILNNKTPLIKK